MKKDIRIKVWKKYNEKCAYCGNGLEYKDLEVDHIHPKHLGGQDEFENYAPSCKSCNFYKSTFTIEKFREQMNTILDRVKKPFIVRLAIKYGLISFKPFDGLFYFEKHKKAFSLNGVVSCVCDCGNKINWLDESLRYCKKCFKTVETKQK